MTLWQINQTNHTVRLPIRSQETATFRRDSILWANKMVIISANVVF